MTYFLAIFLFILGLTAGSFLNVIAFRYSPEKSLFDFKNYGGRSRCPRCGKTLKWYELAPILSFLIQKGKCRGCGARLSWQYLFVELASGFIFLLPLYFLSPLVPVAYAWISSIVWILIFLVFLLIWIIDYRYFIIPDELNFILAAAGLILIVVNDYHRQFGAFRGSFLGGLAGIFGFRDDIWFNHIGGALLAILFIGLIIILTRQKGMGMGDLKLAGALGLIFGWPDFVFALAFSFLIGAILSGFLLFSGKKKLWETVPFGPFLVLGSITLIFFGQTILEFYFRIFNSL